MKKLYYGPMVLGLAALALGSQVTSATSVLATDGGQVQEEQPATTETKTPDTTTTEDGAKSTHGTWDEAIAKYNTDLSNLETRVNGLNGENELLTYVKGQVTELKAAAPTDGKDLATKFFELRVLGRDLEQNVVLNATVTDGDKTLTATNISATGGDTNGFGSMGNHIFKSGSQNIKMNDGSTMSIEYGANSSENTSGIKSITLTDVDGNKKVLDGKSIVVSVTPKSTVDDLLYWASCTQDNLKLYDQSNDLVKAAEEALPTYIEWLSNEGQTATSKEAQAKSNEYDTKYITPIEKALTPGSDIFPNPDGTTYTYTSETTDKPTTGTNTGNTSSNHHNNSSNHNNKPADTDTDKPTTKPADEKTTVAHSTVFMTSATDNVVLYTEDGAVVKDRALGKNSTWKADKLMTLNGVQYLRVATNEWVKLSDGLEIESLNSAVTTKNQARLYSADGKLVSDRALAPNTAWRTDRKATINGKTMYRVATNEWVAAADLK
ncbi:SLAP domain-containing protein [Companilactobacillus muriivasis]|uniref:SLAP domain-containing protein n=1 Tax=Companilactobacillus muriivasis TaxID=3081444 RepID=UPI0030C76601